MEYNTKSNDDRSVCAKNEVKNIQCVEVEKRLKKSVDKRRKRWYDNKAVARESKTKEPETLMNSGFRGSERT